jgi:DNA-binding transcriptional ArsR family regulator
VVLWASLAALGATADSRNRRRLREGLTGDHLVTYEGLVRDDGASPGGRDLDPDEPVFRALADGQRRVLLDRLFERDGQTLAELCAALPHLSRFGVMKHLSVLEQASLVTARRDGRHKVHFLNPVPIRGIHDRWISKYATPWIDVLSGLRDDLEQTDRAHPAQHDAIA